MSDRRWLQPIAEGVRRVTEVLTSFAVSPDDRWIALWGRAPAGSLRRPHGTVVCAEAASGREVVALPGGDLSVAQAAFVRPDALWVLRYSSSFEGDADLTLTAYAMPGGEIRAEVPLPGVGCFPSLQLAAAGDAALVAEDLGAWAPPDDRGDARWYVLHRDDARVLQAIDPYRIPAALPEEEQAEIEPWEFAAPSLSPRGARLCVRYSGLGSDPKGGRVVLADVDPRGATSALAGRGAAYDRGAVWLGEDRVVDLGTDLDAGPRLVVAEEGALQPLLDLGPRELTGAPGAWQGYRLWMALHPDGQQLLLAGTTADDGQGTLALLDLASGRVGLRAALAGTTARRFGAAWLEGDEVAIVTAPDPDHVAVEIWSAARGRRGLWRPLPAPPKADLVRLQVSPLRRFLALDWYDEAVQGWTALLLDRGS